jgi:acetate kinase
MNDYILVLNAGSSSLKFCVYQRAETDSWSLKSRGQIEGLGTSPRLIVRDAEIRVLIDQVLDCEVRDVPGALDVLTSWLTSNYGGAQLLGVGHRVVHGGAHYTRPTLVTSQVLLDLHRLEPFAPLHQPYSLAAIETVLERLPHVSQVACFDTSFHQGRPTVSQVVPLPLEIYHKGVQRYGFHGLSYEYITTMLPEVAPEIAGGRIILAHLGSGASLCALKGGKSVDTSLGFTALDGLCMSTRPGAVDPGVILYLFQSLGLSTNEVENILYKKSGLLGLSGISGDVRVLLASNDPKARLAVDYFVYRAVKEVGAMAAVLGGVEGIVFTAGIGENSAEIRKRICEASAWLGLEIDSELNARSHLRISRPASKVSAWVIPTNEELIIAKHTSAVLGLAAVHA